MLHDDNTEKIVTPIRAKCDCTLRGMSDLLTCCPTLLWYEMGDHFPRNFYNKNEHQAVHSITIFITKMKIKPTAADDRPRKGYTLHEDPKKATQGLNPKSGNI